MRELSLRIEGLVKKYPMFKSKRHAMYAFLFSRKNANDTFVALENINVEIHKGERIGLVGLNGSGKSTLSSLIAGITYPSDGTVEVNGKVSMLSTSAGLKTALTGRENIYYKCLLLGFSREQIAAMEEDIIAFADIGVFIDQPLRVYSSGMRTRLGFAISVQLCPDILVVDEALSVGDESFANKCKERMNAFSDEEKTIIFVSHSKQQMYDFCSRVVWLHRGHQIAFGDVKEVMGAYSRFCTYFSGLTKTEKDTFFPVYDDFCS